MLKYLLDTNICIYTIKNKPQEIRGAFSRHYGQFAISAIALMELIYDAEKSVNPERNLAVIEGFSARLEVQAYGFNAAVHTGQIRAELARQGTPSAPMMPCWQAMRGLPV